MLPIRTSVRPFRTPYMNYALIVVNVLIFFLTYYPHQEMGYEQVLRPWADQFMLNPARPSLWQFVSYAFLHGGIMHIFGNMFFLYMFGNNVNDKLGNIGYLCFYLAGAVFSGIGHTLLNINPALGASGAVCAVTGAYLVLFPKTLITVVYWFIFIGTMDVPALYFIALKLILIDNVIATGTQGIAYDAHLAGYAYGILAVLGLLGTGLISTSHFDLWAMLKQWNRRRHYRDVVTSGYNSFTDQIRAKRIKVKQVKKTPKQKEAEEKVKKLRNEINSRINQRNLPVAAQLYMDLMILDSSQLPPRQSLLDIANQLASENKHIEAAEAYEKFLTHYGNYEYTEQVELMVGLIYSRYLNKPELAIRHLEAAMEKLKEPGQLKMSKDELRKLKNNS